MDLDRWRQIERLYHDALAHSAEERQEFLAAACAGDEELQRDVQALFDASATAEGFLAAPAVAMAGQMIGRDAGASVPSGWRLGVYQLQERIGAGGMDI